PRRGGEALLECLQLGPRRQIAVQEQVGDFLESALLSELRHRVAAIAQPAGDRGDGCLAGDDAFQTGGVDFGGGRGDYSNWSRSLDPRNTRRTIMPFLVGW